MQENLPKSKFLLSFLPPFLLHPTLATCWIVVIPMDGTNIYNLMVASLVRALTRYNVLGTTHGLHTHGGIASIGAIVSCEGTNFLNKTLNSIIQLA